MKKLLKINKPIILFMTAAVLYGCGDGSTKEDFTARVNKSYLNKQEIDSIFNNSNTYKSEIIRSWVNRELLYQEASKEGVLKSEEFLSAIENSKKELAAAMMLKKMIEKKEIKTDFKTLQFYYEEHINDFKLDEDSFIINILKTDNEDNAIRYRNIIIENNWKRLSTTSGSENSGLSVLQNIMKSKTELHPASLMRMISELNPGETSIVMNDGNNSFYVVQLINKFPKGTIPPLEFIKTDVENRYSLALRNKYIQEYLQELYSNNDIEIRTGKK